MILFIDDEPHYISEYMAAMKDEGYNVICKSDISEAVSFYEKHFKEIELVVLDVMMDLPAELPQNFKIKGLESALRAGEQVLEILNTIANCEVCTKLFFTNLSDETFHKTYKKSNKVYGILKKRGTSIDDFLYIVQHFKNYSNLNEFYPKDRMLRRNDLLANDQDRIRKTMYWFRSHAENEDIPFIKDALKRGYIKDSTAVAYAHEIIQKLQEKPNSENNIGRKKISRKNKLNFLFIAANPINHQKLAQPEEHQVISDEIQNGDHRDKFNMLQPVMSATKTKILRAIHKDPNIIHFSGHGKKSGILVSNTNKKSNIIGAETLRDVFKQCDNLKLVVLNSCYSATQAGIISDCGAYVICMNAPIEDKAAIKFATGLYIGLSSGVSIEKSFNDGVLMMSKKYKCVPEIWKEGEKINNKQI